MRDYSHRETVDFRYLQLRYVNVSSIIKENSSDTIPVAFTFLVRISQTSDLSNYPKVLKY